jgi:adenylate cyclase
VSKSLKRPPASKPGSSTPGHSDSSTERPSRIAAAIVIASFTAAWALALAAVGLGRDWNARLDDLAFQLRWHLRGTEPIERSIAIVDIGDADVAALAMRMADRAPYARLVRVLDAAGASSIIFDIVFPADGEPAGDLAFAEAGADAGTLILPLVLRAGAGSSAKGIPDTAPPPGAVWHPRVLTRGAPPAAASATASFPMLAAVARGTGNITSEPDSDGTYRRMPMLTRWGDGYVPALALAAAVDALDVDPSRIEVDLGRRIRLPDATMPDGSVRTIDIPVDRAGRMVMNFTGPLAASFTHYPLARLLEAETDPDVADAVAAELEGARLIVADVTANGKDFGPVPLEGVYPLSGLHASILNGILQDRFVRQPFWAETLVVNLLAVAFLWLAAWRLRPLAFSLAGIGCAVIVAAVELGMFIVRGVLPSLAAPVLGIVAVLVSVNGWRFAVAERQKLILHARMERYFAPRLLQKILEAPDRLMSAEKKVVSVLFSDIAGFTAWSTTQQPDAIHATLNEYFEQMTAIVFRHEGTVDKFIGDGMMAFFGDPLAQPDHALRAVHTAIEMQQAMRKLRAAWEAAHAAALHIRIGISTGEMVVGNMGSRRIMAYTVIGANVNLGSRLEGKAPVDGILVSGAVHDAVGDAVPMKFAGNMTAKGIAKKFATWAVPVP